MGILEFYLYKMTTLSIETDANPTTKRIIYEEEQSNKKAYGIIGTFMFISAIAVYYCDPLNHSTLDKKVDLNEDLIRVNKVFEGMYDKNYGRLNEWVNNCETYMNQGVFVAEGRTWCQVKAAQAVTAFRNDCHKEKHSHCRAATGGSSQLVDDFIGETWQANEGDRLSIC